MVVTGNNIEYCEHIWVQRDVAADQLTAARCEVEARLLMVVVRFGALSAQKQKRMHDARFDRSVRWSFLRYSGFFVYLCMNAGRIIFA
jgi:hypothetical protein